jgi:uncharacterized tellurite resistance protein B-like protein
MEQGLLIEIEQITDCMYQNLEQQSYEWIQTHLMGINEFLLAVIQARQNEGQDTAELEQQAVKILRQLIDATTKHHILALADCLRYEVYTFGQ